MEYTNEMLDLIRARRSCRRYLPDPPDEEVITAIVEAGRQAPTSRNREQSHFYVITDPELLSLISGTVSRRREGYAERDCCFGAPVLVLLTHRRDNVCALQDAGCIMENMMLAAAALGLGSCWMNQVFHLREDEEMQRVLSRLGVPPEEFCCGCLTLGLPAGELFPGARKVAGHPVTWLRGK